MARPKKIKEVDQALTETVTETPSATPVSLPYALRRELEEITKNTGRTFDLSLPLTELEKICNQSNYPPDSWRDRWIK